MRLGARAAGLLAIVALGCANRDPVAISHLTPRHGPVVGGSVITIHGHGFESAPPGETRVLIGGREAPLVATVDDSRLEVATPPGARPGVTDVVLVIGDHAVQAAGAFRYSAPPTIAAVAPADVLYEGSARVTVTGSGFTDEDAGDPVLVVDGQAVEVEVESDTTLTFVPPGGRPLREPDLELANRRGRTSRARAFRYVPGPRPGLLLFGAPGSFATFFDPVDLRTVDIPWAAGGGGFTRLTTVVRDARGDYWAFDRSRQLARLDLSEQRLEGGIFPNRQVSAMERVGDTFIVIDRGLGRLGRLDPAGGAFTVFGDSLPCCGSFGIAFDGTTLHVSTRFQDGGLLFAIDPATGVTLSVRSLLGVPDLHVEEMRYLAGTLYASDRSGRLVTIDPATGAVTVLPVSVGPGGGRAIAVFE